MNLFAQTANPSSWKTMTGAMSLLVDEITLVADIDGVRTWGISEGAKALEIVLPNAVFEKYECEKKIKLTVRSEEIAKVLRNASDKDRVIASVDTINDGLSIKFQNGISQEYNLHLIETIKTDDPKKVPDSPDANIKIQVDGMTDILTKMRSVTNEIALAVSSQSLVVSAVNYGESMKATVTLDSKNPMFASFDCQKECTSRYFLETVLGMLKSLKSAKEVVMNFGEHRPLIIHGDLDGIGSKFTYFQAPTIGPVK